MTVSVVLTPANVAAGGTSVSTERVQVKLQIDADVLSAEAAMHAARIWLRQNISKSISVAEPELVVDDGLYWRFNIMLEVHNHMQPGSGAYYSVGEIRLVAATGEVDGADALVAELRARIASLDL